MTSSSPQPLIVVPSSRDFARVFDRDLERIRKSERAREVGIVVLMPREVQPATLMFAAYAWPQVLRGIGVKRIAVVLGVGAYALAQPLLGSCIRRMAQDQIDVEFFHEVHVEAGAMRAWTERSGRRKRVTTDQLVRVCERYAERGDLRSAMLALKLAEETAGLDTKLDAPAEQKPGAKPTVKLRGEGADDNAPKRVTAELPAA